MPCYCSSSSAQAFSGGGGAGGSLLRIRPPLVGYKLNLQHLVFWSFIEIWKRIIIELPVSIHNWDAYITRPSLSLTLNIIFMIKNHSIVVGRPSLGSRISFRMDASSRASAASKATSPSLKYLIDGNPGDGEVEVSLVALPNQTVVHSSQSSTVSLKLLKLIILLTFFTKQMIQCHFKQYRFLLCNVHAV